MVENLDERLDRIEVQIGELRGQLKMLESMLLNRPSETVDRHGSLKTAITFVSIVIVPVLVSILGGYFALRAAGLR